MGNLEDLVQNFNSYATEQEFEIPTFNLNNAGDSPVLEWDELSTPIQKSVQKIAEGVFDPTDHSVIVMGGLSSGKTFLIRQFVAAQNFFKKNLVKQYPTFLDLTGVVSRQVTPNNYLDYVAAISHSLAVDVEDICFITQNLDSAWLLQSAGAKVILEIDSSTYWSVIEKVPFFDKWNVVNANLVNLPKGELIASIAKTTIPDLEKQYTQKFNEKDIENFIGYFEKDHDLYEDPDEPNAVSVPPGKWARGFRKYASLSALSETDIKKAPSRKKLIKENYETLQEVLEIAQRQDGATLDEHPLARLLGSGGGGMALPMGPIAVNADDFKKMLSGVFDEEEEETPVPVEFKFRSNKEFKRRILKDVIGQNNAIDEVANGMMIPAAGLNVETKPLRSFLFLGPTGVGKTQTALSLSKNLCTDEMNVIRLDMSEYSESHQVNKIIGAPHGYAGYKDPSPLISKVKEFPNSVILLDEVEKAHPKIWDAFLQVLDAGRMTTATGEEIDFTNTVLIMTSNLGAEKLSNSSRIGFSVDSAQNAKDQANIANRAAEGFFRPEFINRIDQKIVFSSLPESSIVKILLKELNTLNDRAHNRGYTLLKPNSDILNELMKRSDTSKYGAREIQRTVEQSVYRPLASAILSQSASKTLSLRLDKNNEIEVIPNEDNGGNS